MDLQTYHNTQDVQITTKKLQYIQKKKKKESTDHSQEKANLAKTISEEATTRGSLDVKSTDINKGNHGQRAKENQGGGE